MTKEEFTSRAKKPITDSDYKKVEKVYTFHPSIDPNKGKDQIASLYDTFGMRIIEDMIPTAEKAAELEDKIRHARMEIERLTEEYRELKEGR